MGTDQRKQASEEREERNSTSGDAFDEVGSDDVDRKSRFSDSSEEGDSLEGGSDAASFVSATEVSSGASGEVEAPSFSTEGNSNPLFKKAEVDSPSPSRNGERFTGSIQEPRFDSDCRIGFFRTRGEKLEWFGSGIVALRRFSRASGSASVPGAFSLKGIAGIGGSGDSFTFDGAVSRGGSGRERIVILAGKRDSCFRGGFGANGFEGIFTFSEAVAIVGSGKPSWKGCFESLLVEEEATADPEDDASFNHGRFGSSGGALVGKDEGEGSSTAERRLISSWFSF